MSMSMRGQFCIQNLGKFEPFREQTFMKIGENRLEMLLNPFGLLANVLSR